MIYFVQFLRNPFIVCIVLYLGKHFLSLIKKQESVIQFMLDTYIDFQIISKRLHIFFIKPHKGCTVLFCFVFFISFSSLKHNAPNNMHYIQLKSNSENNNYIQNVLMKVCQGTKCMSSQIIRDLPQPLQGKMSNIHLAFCVVANSLLFQSVNGFLKWHSGQY